MGAAKQHLRSRAALALAGDDLADLHATDAYFDRRTGATMVYLTQRHAGIEVWGAIAPVAVLPGGKTHALAPRHFESRLATRVSATTPRVASGEAASAAEAYVARLRGPAPAGPLALSDDPNEVREAAAVTFEATAPRLVYQPTEGGPLRLAWATTLTASGGPSQMWAVRVDALTGTVLAADDLVDRDRWPTETSASGVSASGAPASFAPLAPEAASLGAGAGAYRVIPWPAESPDRAAPTVVPNPSDATASPNGWHDTGLQSFTTTRGNNVWAYLDRNDDDQPDAGLDTDGGPSLSFDFAYVFTNEPSENKDAAVTNLFYWGNIFHDITYQYGFDEAAGNFQVNNFGLGGLGNDAARLESQSGADICNENNPCLNNANFGTPNDGAPGRMQMYEWTGSTFEVTAPAGAAGTYPSAQASFGPVILVSDMLVVVEDPNGQPGRACSLGDIANAGEVVGRIALIERGGCNFVTKIRTAEAAGAIAVVVHNNDRMGAGETGDPEELVLMGLPDGDVDNVGIPSVFVQYSTGLRLRFQTGVALTFGPLIRRDSGLDSGVIVHEFGHGLSNRLTGGPSASGCLSNGEQMGEGWSDYYGLLLTMQASGDTPRGIGTYLTYEGIDGEGIRPAPYTRDFSTNALTYQDVISSNVVVPHGLGTVWASMLWDMTLDLIDQYGFDANAYNADGGAGNQIALNLVTQGLKLQPCRPGFVDGRDAILEADTLLYGGANSDLIWAAFARRGLGINADQGLSSDPTDGTADFNATVASERGPNASGARLAIDGPNPVRRETAVALTLASPEAVTVEVLDLLGRRVRTLHEGPLAAARHAVAFDARGLAPGVYVVRAEGETFAATQRVTVIR